MPSTASPPMDTRLWMQVWCTRGWSRSLVALRRKLSCMVTSLSPSGCCGIASSTTSYVAWTVAWLVAALAARGGWGCVCVPVEGIFAWS